MEDDERAQTPVPTLWAESFSFW